MSRRDTARLLTAMFVLIVGFCTLDGVVKITREAEATPFVSQGIKLGQDEAADSIHCDNTEADDDHVTDGGF